MKKIAYLCLLLCLMILLQCTLQPAIATEPADTATQETSPTVTSGNASVTNGCRTINGQVPLGGSDRMLETAQAAFVYEVTTDTVIYGYNPDLRLSPGSLIKVLTALIAVEECQLSEEVHVDTNSISKLPAGTITAKLKNGEIITMEDALYLLILQSANDAALMIAEHIAGSEAVFVELMNERAKELGCTNTIILNCHGLDTQGQYTTARDIAKITRAAMENETFRTIFGTNSYTMGPTNLVEKERTVNTSNHLIYAMVLPQFPDQRVTGGMPSYTSVDTGASIVFTAEDEGMSLIYVIMGATRTFKANGNADYYGNFEESHALLDYSFDGYHIKEVLYDGQALNQFPVSNGESAVVGQPNESFVTVLPVDVHMNKLRFEYSATGGGMYAPIEAGQQIATVRVWYITSCLTEANIYAMNPVRATDNTGVDIQGAGRDDSNVSGVLSFLGGALLVIVIVVGGYLGYNNLRRYLRRSRRRRRRASRRRSR